MFQIQDKTTQSQLCRDDHTREDNSDANVKRECEEQSVVMSPQIPKTKESQIAVTDSPDISRARTTSFNSSLGKSCEKTSLLGSTSLSFSYSERENKLRDADESQRKQIHPFGVDKFSEIQSSVMTEFQASLFLPSLMLSSYSTIRHSYEHHVQRSTVQSTVRRSFHGSRSVAVSLVEKLSDDRGASLVLTVCNMLPYLTGTTIFTLPYVIRNSGYVALLILISISILANISSFLLVDTMYEMSPKSKKRKRVHGDFADIARAAFGETASKLVNMLLIAFLFSSNIAAIVLTGKAFYVMVFAKFSWSIKAVTALTSILVIPILFIRKLTHLAYLNMLALISLITGAIVTMAMFIQREGAWKGNLEDMPLFQWDSFAFSLSVWQFTLIVHTVLPQVEGCMREPAKISKALHISHITGTLIKVIYGLMGAFAFGVDVDMLIGDNISRVKFAAGIVVNASMAAYSVFAFPLCFFVVCNAIDSIAVSHKKRDFLKGGKYHFSWLLFTRSSLIAICIAVAIALPHFGPLIGVLGALLGTVFVFVLPCLFHLKLKWREMSWVRIAFDMFILIVGSTAGVIGLYASVKALSEALRGS